MGGGGHWAHGEVAKVGSQRSGNWAELGFCNAMVIWRDNNRVEVKNEGRGTVGILGAATCWRGVGTRQIQR